MNSQAAKLRTSMDQGIVMCPGAWNGLVGAAIAKAGFA